MVADDRRARSRADAIAGQAAAPRRCVVAGAPGANASGGATAAARTELAGWVDHASGWLRARLGLGVMALLVGAGAGLGAVGSRWLVFGFTWLATGHEQFGQQGRVGSVHRPWLGTGFLPVVPVLGGLIYDPVTTDTFVHCRLGCSVRAGGRAGRGS
jgi:hypothetical protein